MTATVGPAADQVYISLLFWSYAVAEPNDNCGSAYPIQPNRTYRFLPDDLHDWYQIDLTGSGNLTVQLLNFIPMAGQIAVYKGESCGMAQVLSNNGNSGQTKAIHLGLQTSGRYYIYVSNDGDFNTDEPYSLSVQFP